MRNTALYVLACVFAIPAVYGFFAGVMHLLVSICLFFAAVESEQAPFMIVTLVLSAIAAGCAASVWHQLSGNDAWYVRTWANWAEYHRVDILHYGIAVVGALSGGTSFALLLNFSPAPMAMGFGVFVCAVGLVASGLSAFRVGAELVSSTYNLYQNRSQATQKQSRRIY